MQRSRPNPGPIHKKDSENARELTFEIFHQLVTVASGAEYELPCSLQKDEGEEVRLEV